MLYEAVQKIAMDMVNFDEDDKEPVLLQCALHHGLVEAAHSHERSHARGRNVRTSSVAIRAAMLMALRSNHGEIVVSENFEAQLLDPGKRSGDSISLGESFPVYFNGGRVDCRVHHIDCIRAVFSITPDERVKLRVRALLHEKQGNGNGHSLNTRRYPQSGEGRGAVALNPLASEAPDSHDARIQGSSDGDTTALRREAMQKLATAVIRILHSRLSESQSGREALRVIGDRHHLELGPRERLAPSAVTRLAKRIASIAEKEVQAPSHR